MITSFEVGAVFRILDEASPALKKLLEQIRALNKAVEQARLNIQGMMKSLGVDLAPAISETRALAAEWKAVSTAAQGARRSMAFAARAAAVPAGAGAAAAAAGGGGRVRPGYGRRMVAGGGGHGGSGGAHISSIGVPFPGGHANFRGGGNAGLLAAGLLGYGVYEEAEIEDIIARAMITGQIKIGPEMRQMDAFKEMRDIIQHASTQGGFSPKEVGESLLTVERQFGGLKFSERMEILKTLVPAAMTEAKMKESGLPEAFEALVGLAHMTGTFDPKQLPEIIRGFTYASTVTPASIERFRNALGYSMPILHAGLNMDPSSIMFLTAMTQTAGITNTKSGTWLRTFFERLQPIEGEHLEKHDKRHNEALMEMGLATRIPGRPGEFNLPWQIKGAGGQLDWMASVVRLAEMLQASLATMKDSQRLGTLHEVFGERGGGFAALMNLPQFVEQLPVIAQKMKSFAGGDDILAELARVSPAQQAKNAFAELQTVLMDLGQIVLPPLTSALKDFATMLREIKSMLPGGTKGDKESSGPSIWGSVGKRAGEGAIIGGVGGAVFGPGAIPGALVGGAAGTIVGIDDYFKEKRATATATINRDFSAMGEVVQGTGDAAKSAASNMDALRRALEAFGNSKLSVPPAPTPSGSSEKHSSIIMDGRVVGELVMKQIADRSTRPLEGSAHFDSTWTSPASDVSYA